MAVISLIVLAALAASPRPPVTGFSPAERIEILKAAGAVRRGATWVMCADDPAPVSATVRAIDLNGDGRPEAIVTERTALCAPKSGWLYAVLARADNGGWQLLARGDGQLRVIGRVASGGWRDLRVTGGDAPVILRHDGQAYRPR